MRRAIFFIILILSCINIFADVNFPKPTGFVNDFADVLTGAEENTLAEIVVALERDTTAEIAVVTVNTTQPLSIEEYSVRLFSEWGIGKKGKDNGVLLLVAVEDRAVKIEVGYGLEGMLPDGLCGEIIRGYIIPEFKSGRYGTGIIGGVNAIVSVITGKETGYKQVPSGEPEIVGEIRGFIQNIIVFLFIMVFLLSIFLPRRRYRSTLAGPGFGGFGGGSFGGGFGGFGGGMSGGGGAVGRW